MHGDVQWQRIEGIADDGKRHVRDTDRATVMNSLSAWTAAAMQRVAAGTACQGERQMLLDICCVAAASYCAGYQHV
jgi:hypothetical protein